MKTAIGPVCLTLLLCGCPAAKPPLYPTDGGLSSDEADATDRVGRGSNAIQALADISDNVFNFDPTLDTTKDATTNAMAIQSQATTALNGCGSATVNGTTVTVDFGMGCTLKSGTIASGSISVGVTKTGTMLSLTFTMTMLKVNGSSLDGSLTMNTGNATSFTTIGSLTTSDGSYNVNLTLSGTATSIGISGTLQEAMGGDGGTGKTSNYTFTFVVWNRADCYPNSGAVKIQRGAVASTITFDAMTATTGKVSVSTGRVSVPGQLPSYGSCPMM
jgi:hypothetical protein